MAFDKSKVMKFRTDKSKVYEGESFIVSWDCQNPEMVSLTVEDGAKSQIPLPDSGSRTISASGNADKIVLTLHASIGGRVQVKKAVLRLSVMSSRPKRCTIAPDHHLVTRRYLTFQRFLHGGIPSLSA